MPSTVPYCTVDNLMLSNMQAPTNAQRYVDEAAEEIDSRIGFKYETPVVVDNSSQSRPTTLLLRRINSWLASGRLLMAAAAPAQDDQIQQYALYLVTQADAALKQIESGEILLPGAPIVGGSEQSNTGPVASFGDSESLVEAFGVEFGDPAKETLSRVRLPVYYEPWNRRVM